MGDAFADELLPCARFRYGQAREIATAQGKLQFRPNGGLDADSGPHSTRCRRSPSRFQFKYHGRDGRAIDS